MRSFLPILHTTSGYGPRTDPFDGQAQTNHEGVDFRANYEALVTPERCSVLRVGSSGVSGTFVSLRPDSDPSIYLVFCHLSQALCQAEEKLAEGTVFAVTGNSGRSTAPHLHFGIRRMADDTPVDPTEYLEKMVSPVLAALGSSSLPGVALALVGIGLLLYALGGK